MLNGLDLHPGHTDGSKRVDESHRHEQAMFVVEQIERRQELEVKARRHGLGDAIIVYLCRTALELGLLGTTRGE